MAGLKESLNKGLTTLNVKTNNFMEGSKSKTYITTLENEIKDAKLRLGELVYVNVCKGEEPASNTEELIELIKDREQKIELERQRMIQLQEEEQQILGTTAQKAPAQSGGTVFCGQCGNANASVYKFCCKCGAPLS